MTEFGDVIKAITQLKLKHKKISYHHNGYFTVLYFWLNSSSNFGRKAQGIRGIPVLQNT